MAVEDSIEWMVLGDWLELMREVDQFELMDADKSFELLVEEIVKVVVKD
jgi:hypothetical protein